MNIKNNIMKIGILSTGTLHVGTYSMNSFADKWDNLETRGNIYNKASQSNNSFNIDKYINEGKININEDVSVSEVEMTPEEVASSPLTQLTQEAPVIMGLYDGANDMGTIQILNMKRHPDGSATLYQRNFSPYDFDLDSNGGQLSRNEFSVLEERFGQNPFDSFKSGEEQYRNAFIKIEPVAFQTAMGIAMQRYNSTVGIYGYMEPQVRTWTTTSGGIFSKKVTTHVRAHFQPHWYLLTGTDIGDGHGIVGKPLYALQNGNVVLSGVNVHKVGNARSNFNNERFEVFYDKKSERGITGFGLIAVAVVLGAATGGMGFLGGAGWVTGGLGSGALTAGYATAMGNTDLHKVAAGDWKNIGGISDTNSLEHKSKWHQKWQNNMRDRVNEGPMGNNLGSINSEFKKEKDNWEQLTIPPSY